MPASTTAAAMAMPTMPPTESVDDDAAAGSGFGDAVLEAAREAARDGVIEGVAETEGVADATAPRTVIGAEGSLAPDMTPRSTSGLYTSLNSTMAASVCAIEAVTFVDTNVVRVATNAEVGPLVEFANMRAVKTTFTPSGAAGVACRRRPAEKYGRLTYESGPYGMSAICEM